MPPATTSTANIIDAIAFAADAHRDQRRKGADAAPYINHPIALLRILAVEAGIEEPDVLCAAALHDYIEDCCGAPGQPTVEEGRSIVRERFGDIVLRYVDAVTDDKSLKKVERKRLQIEHAAQLPHGARLVKLADKIANLRDMARCPPVDWSRGRVSEYFAWAGAVVEQMRGTNARLETLFDSAHQEHQPDA
ncbi:MAG TPA: HD domain-containing protein [Xanthomonadaceae bacterium]|jgi:guanosine-3',5'-bis(diphosphate) 3'-pyrophosphohydrolase|nr:HD domain-containing protein [Xanthomonadaceae bacterium]